MARRLRAASGGAVAFLGLGLALVLSPTVGLAQESDLAFLPAPAVRDLRGSQLLDITRAGDRLVAVGATGLVILSDDSGTTWRQASVPVSATLTAVDFVSRDAGWAVGHAGVILHSGDGGESWVLQHDGRDTLRALGAFARERRAELEAALDAIGDAGDGTGEGAAADVDAADLDDLEYALEDAIFLEEDAADALEAGPADPLLDVTFVDAEHGYAAGAYGIFLRTEDGGQSWQLAIGGIDNPDRFHYYAIHPSPSQGLFLAGEAGLLYRSVDGGASFERYDDVYGGSFFGVLEAAGSVIAFGLRGNQFAYDPAADSWAAVDSVADFSVYGGGVLGGDRLLLLGAGGSLLLREPDGTSRELLHPSRATLAAASEAADGRVWIVGMAGLVDFARAVTP